MKKFFISLAGILTAASAMALDWSAIENYAQGGQVTVSTNEGAKNTIVDGNDGSSWQATGHSNAVHPDMFIIDMGQSRTVNQFQILWEASHPNTYDIYVSATAIPVASQAGCNVVTESWLNANTPVASRDVPGNGGATDEFELATPATGQYILMMGKTYNSNATNYGSRCFEFRCGYLMREEAKASKVNLNMTADEYTAVGMEYDVTAEVVDQYGDRFDATPTVTVTGGTYENGKLTVTAKGQVSIQAKYNDLESGIITMNSVVDLDEYVDGGTATSDTELSNAAALFDGGATLSSNGAEYKLADGGDRDPHWLLIDKGREIDIDGIYITWEGASANAYTVEVGPTPENLTEVLSIDAPGGIVARKDWVTDAAKMKGARYIKINTTSTGTEWGLKIYEVKVYGIAKAVDPIATSIELTLDPEITQAAIGQSVTATAKVLDQLGKDFDAEPTLSVEGPAEIENGKVSFTGLGTVTVKAVSGELSTEMVIDVVIDATHYVIDANTTATNDLGYDAAELAKMFDGKSDPAENGSQFQVVLEGSDEAQDRDAAHWVLVDLKRPVDIEAVVINWEGASADKYNVEMGETVETLTKVYEVDEDHGVKARRDWFYGQEAKGVRYVRVNTLHAASGYGMKIQDLKIYGQVNYTPVATSMKLDVKTDAPYMTGDIIRLDAGVADQYGYLLDAEVNYTTTAGTLSQDAETGETIFIPAAKGTAEIKAVAGELENSIELDIVADIADYLTGADFAATGTYTSNAGEEMVDAELPGIFDGDATDNGAQEGQIGTEPAVINIDLNGPHFVDMITLSWEAACSGTMTVSVWGEDQTEEDATEVFSIEGRKLKNGVNPVDRIVVPAELGAIRYARINITEPASGYGMRLYEARVFGRRDVRLVSFSANPTVNIEGKDVKTDVIFLGETLNFNSQVMNNFGETVDPAEWVVYLVNEEETALENDSFTPETEGNYQLSAIVDGFDAQALTVKAVDATRKLLYIHKGVQLSLGEGHPSHGVRDVVMGGNHTGVSEIDVTGATVTLTFDEPIDLSALQLRWRAASKVTCKVAVAETADDTPEAVELEGGDLHRMNLASPVKKIVISDIDATFSGANLVEIAPIYTDGDLALEEKSEEDLANEGIEAGISTVGVDSLDGDVRYFNLQGVEVVNPASGSIVIMRRGNSVEKVLVK